MIRSKAKKRIVLVALTIALACLFLPKIALAAYSCPKGYITLQVPIPAPGNQDDFCVKGLPEYVQRIYNFFISVVGILAVIMVMFGGFQWLIAGGNPTKISTAKAQIISALAGLTLMLSSYLILNLINPKLTQLQLAGINELKTRQYDNYGRALSSCPITGATGQYIEASTGEAVDGAKTLCGKDYYVQTQSGEQVDCKGKFCEDTSRPNCFETVCTDGQWYGYIVCVSKDEKCVDNINVNLLCRDKNTKEYSFEQKGSVDVDERDNAYKITNLNAFVLRNVTNVNDLCGTGGTKEAVGFFPSVEVKIPGFWRADRWRGLSSMGGGNAWQSNGALCNYKKPSEYTQKDWETIVQRGGLMPANLFIDGNMPVLYFITLGDTNKYKEMDKDCF